MNTSPPKTAALFDLDGTLVDSLQDIAESMNTVLTASGFPPHPLAAYRHFVGEGLEALVQRTLPATASPAQQAANLNAMRATYAERWQTHATPYPGIRGLLRDLVNAGLGIGVMSNKPEAFTRAMVQHVFPDLPWAHLRGAREGIPVKPAPDGGRALLQEWGRSPEEVWYLGDTKTDIQFAHAVGMPSIGVTWGFRDRNELAAHGAGHIVDTPQEAGDLILGR
jgi:phosphoglycolate phosphatase